MGLGPYTAQRAHEFKRLAVASGVKNPEQAVHVGDRRARDLQTTRAVHVLPRTMRYNGPP